MRKTMYFYCRITALCLAVLWLFQTPLWAAIYKWKDDRGKIHFTDDKSRIPLKYRHQLEKFKGVTEPSPIIPDSSGEPEAASKPAEEGPKVSSAAADNADKGPKKSKFTKEQLALLKQVRDYMTKEWAANSKLSKNIEPTKANGKYYTLRATKSAARQKGMIKQIGDTPILSLQEVKKYLKQSSIRFMQLEMGKYEFMPKVQKIKAIVDGDIPQQKALIGKLEKDIGPEDEAAPPPE